MPRVIITVPEKNAQPYRFGLDRKFIRIGRGSDNDIVIDSGSVSGKHAEMHRVVDGYELGDVSSTNGIKHLGVRHEKIALVSGMSLRLGDVSFDFTLTDEELEAIALDKPHGALSTPAEANPQLHPAATEEAPKPKPRRTPAATPQTSSGVGVGMVLLFLVLAAVAFFTGLAIRHQKDTGEALIKAIVNKPLPVKKAAD
jgi:pSer/pThr/pTyr-binding forkhead associated (FHA) protein